MKKYEAVFILDIRKTDDEGAAFIRGFGELISSLGGELEKSVPMGRKQFTYEINKHRAGLYIDFVFNCETSKIAAIKDRYKLDAQVLRNLILIYDRPENAGDTSVLE